MKASVRSAILILGVALVSIMGYLYVTESGPFDRGNRFFLRVPQVFELKKETQLHYRGIAIGRIRNLDSLPGQAAWLVELTVDRGVALSESASFFLDREGVLGRPVLVLKMEGQSGETYFPGDTLETIIQRVRPADR